MRKETSIYNHYTRTHFILFLTHLLGTISLKLFFSLLLLSLLRFVHLNVLCRLSSIYFTGASWCLAQCTQAHNIKFYAQAVSKWEWRFNGVSRRVFMLFTYFMSDVFCFFYYFLKIYKNIYLSTVKLKNGRWQQQKQQRSMRNKLFLFQSFGLITERKIERTNERTKKSSTFIQFLFCFYRFSWTLEWLQVSDVWLLLAQLRFQVVIFLFHFGFVCKRWKHFPFQLTRLMKIEWNRRISFWPFFYAFHLAQMNPLP